MQFCSTLEHFEPDLQASNSSLKNSLLTGRNLEQDQSRMEGPPTDGWLGNGGKGEKEQEKENRHSKHAKMLVILNMQNKTWAGQCSTGQCATFNIHQGQFM